MSDFQLVDPDPAPAVVRHPKNTKTAQDADNKLAEHFLKLLLGSFSERSVAIFSAVFMCLEVAASFFLWYGILQQPDGMRLGGGAIFCAFVLTFEWVRRRRKE